MQVRIRVEFMVDRERDKQDFNNEPDGAELLDVVEQIRTVPRIRPRPVFRFLMAFSCAFPNLGSRLVERRASRSGKRHTSHDVAWRKADWVSSTARVAVAVALIVVLAFGVFGILTVSARNSNPGDFLYSIKRFREEIELAFTWDPAKKAGKNLALAETRLSELDHLLREKKIDTETVAAIADDYSARTQEVEDLLKKDGKLQGAKNIASKLKVVRTTEKNIGERLAAAGPEVSLAPAIGAKVTVRDIGGQKPIAGADSASFEADHEGLASFNVDLGELAEARGLEASIELDGRTEVLPLYKESEPGGGEVTVKVSPDINSLPLGQPHVFEAMLESPDGSPVAGRTVRLKDAAGSSTINGENGDVTLVSDKRGVVSFTVTKTSLDKVSRIKGTLTNGTPTDLGELLVLGGFDGTDEARAPDDVTVFTTGPQSGPQNIKLSNGIVRVEVEGGTPGTVITGIHGVMKSESTGPLTDPSAGNEDATVNSSGPRLILQSPQSAGYEVSFEIPYGEAKLVKTYQVALRKGDAYAVVSCRVRMEGSPGASAPSNGSIDFSKLTIPAGSQVKVSGKEFTTKECVNPRQISFAYGIPTAIVKQNGTSSVMSCPIDSDIYPDFWIADESSISLSVSKTVALGQSTGDGLRVLLGIVDENGLEDIEDISLEGLGDISTYDEQEPAGAFLLLTEPVADELSDAPQEIKLRIFKKYENIL